MTSQGELLIRILLGLGAVVVVPLALPLLGAADRGSAEHGVRRLLWFSAWGLAVALLIGSGPFAVLLALPWALAAISQAAIGVAHLHAVRSLDQVARTAAMLWLALAAACMCLAIANTDPPGMRAGLRWPTPAHFVYAGFVLTLIAAAAHRIRRNRMSLVALIGVLIGMPLLATEIALVPSLQWTGAVFIGLAAVLLAGEQVLAAVSMVHRHGRAAVSLLASSGALVMAMVLATGFGLSTRFPFRWLSLDVMAATHGVLNSLGFTLLAVVGWRLVMSGTEPTVSEHPASAGTRS